MTWGIPFALYVERRTAMLNQVAHLVLVAYVDLRLPPTWSRAIYAVFCRIKVWLIDVLLKSLMISMQKSGCHYGVMLGRVITGLGGVIAESCFSPFPAVQWFIVKRDLQMTQRPSMPNESVDAILDWVPVPAASHATKWGRGTSLTRYWLFPGKSVNSVAPAWQIWMKF